jgi:hypothetical protein
MYIFTVDRRDPAEPAPGEAILLTASGVWRVGPDGQFSRDESVLRFAPATGKIRVTVLEDDTRWEATFPVGSDLSTLDLEFVQVFDPDPGAGRALLEELEQVDKDSVRALRAIASGDGTEGDVARLKTLERRAAQIRYDVWPLLPEGERSPSRPPAPEAES